MLRINVNKEQGFTLIELLVVILIIGILAAIAIPMFMNQRRAAAEAQVKSDIKNAVTTGGIRFSSDGIPATVPGDLNLSEGTTLNITQNDPSTNNNLAEPYPQSSATKWRDHLTPGVEPRPVGKTIESGGWNNLSYRNITFPSGTGHAGAYQGVAINVPQNTEYTAGIAVRSSVDTDISLNIEWKAPDDPFKAMTPTKHTLKAGEWKYITTTGMNKTSDSTGLVVTAYLMLKEVNQTMDVTAIMLNKGKTVNPEAALVKERFCIEGGHESYPDMKFRYSLPVGKVEEGSCAA